VSKGFIWVIAAMSFIWIGMCIGLYVGRRTMSRDVARELCNALNDRRDYDVCVASIIKGVMYQKEIK